VIALTCAPAVVLLARRVSHRRPQPAAGTPARRERHAIASSSPGI